MLAIPPIHLHPRKCNRNWHTLNTDCPQTCCSKTFTSNSEGQCPQKASVPRTLGCKERVDTGKGEKSGAGPKAGINQGRATFTTKGIDGLRAREMSGAGGMVGKHRCGRSPQRQAKEGEDRCLPAGVSAASLSSRYRPCFRKDLTLLLMSQFSLLQFSCCSPWDRKHFKAPHGTYSADMASFECVESNQTLAATQTYDGSPLQESL